MIPKLAKENDRLLRPDRARLRPRIRRDADLGTQGRDFWVLNGAKSWITNGSIADVAVVWARPPTASKGFSSRRHPGFTPPTTWESLAPRVSDLSALFRNCRIPNANHLPRPPPFAIRWDVSTQARSGIAWGRPGAAMASYQTALDYAKSRRIQFGGQPIASHQLVQNKLAWMITEITKGTARPSDGTAQGSGQAQPHQGRMGE